MHINSPLPSSLSSECRKAARIINSFVDPGSGIDIIIPPDILENAKGLAVFTVIKAGFLFSGRAGSGLVIARLPDGTWSAPSAIMTGGMGFGGQVGAELTDFVMVLNTTAAVKTFMHHGSITLGGNISVAAGPVGRNAEASGTASMKSIAAVYSYSKTRGLFAGVSLEGSVILERFDANKKMYGGKVKSKDLLNGSITPPPQAEALYQALNFKFNRSKGRYSYMNNDGYSPRDNASYSYLDNDRYSSLDNDRYSSLNNDRNTHSFESPNNSPTKMSFSRGAVKEMVKGHTMDSPKSRSQQYRPEPQLRIMDSAMVPSHDTSNTALITTGERTGDVRTGEMARALFNFLGEQEGDLPFNKGETISIIKRTTTQNDWWTGRKGDRIGIFPANFVELI
ncbi:hypothetical protein BDB01DRAFT_790109 [Pilobolus umbonatus]|nr:hypothetical protein BDB01DRAFT_790109 [Pilobolus umbonatus]